ncbi:pilus assembly protein [Massilia sp. Dwa41.01b]|uniref:TadE/TadG family type IV pilus assembly protein n=1 Tax=unclassified Massilia TaxID=2609279 RepID=UPI001601ED3F|nr:MULTISPECIES: TadE family protein [unclassified Massilia]QNA88970.1 pilus assembly protein [Massilia sp. Dwa41.01b]
MPSPKRQRGVAAVEFALLVIVFLAFVFGIIELARIMYLYNTLQEVTRRAATAAASTNFRDPAELDRLRYFSVLRNAPGELPLGAPITDLHVRIDYLALVRNADGSLTETRIEPGLLPADPAANRHTCDANPNASTCIRLVRAQVCNPGTAIACEPVEYQMMFPLISVKLPLPRARTTTTAESLGYMPGEAP